MTLRIGIIGYPISHSISPIFQQAALDYYAINARYEAWEVSSMDLPCFVKGLRSPDTLGCNVTVPYKETVIQLLDMVDEGAMLIGAVNTIVNRNGTLVGYNTDIQGFIKALKCDGQFIETNYKALILGAGGSAKAVAMALAEESSQSIVVTNRTLSRAEQLAQSLTNQGKQASALQLGSTELVKVALQSDLIVNCTTLGMKRSTDENLTPLNSAQIPAQALVYDLVYNPPVTPLLREAAKAGARTLGGLPMLVYQGAAAFNLWTGEKAPVKVMMKAATISLKQAQEK